MIKLLKDGKVKIQIGSFKIQDIMENDFISLIEDFNYGLSEKVPIVLNFEMNNNEYYIILNLNECYIIDIKNEIVSTENISLFDFGRLLYKDLLSQQKEIINYSSNIFEEEKEIKDIFNLNLRSLNILLNQEDFMYKKGNIEKNTLEILNNALYLHSFGCVYDEFENVESFRLFTYDKIYLILHTIINKKTKTDLIIINEDITSFSKKILNNFKEKRKLKSTQVLLKDLKQNLKEYGVRI